MAKRDSIKLLIVDDHRELRRTIRQMFGGLPTTCLEAESGEQAVQLFAQERPDWVIMDIRMPGMGGIAAAQAIRKVSANVRIVLISQFSDPTYEEKAAQIGAVRFLNKEDLLLLPQIIQP